MKKQFTILFATLVIHLLLFTSCKTPKNEDAKEVAATPSEYGGYSSQAKWGEHLVMAGGCGDCHTPKKMSPMGPVDDSSLLLSGHPAQMPPPNVNRLEMQKNGYVVTQTLTAWVGPWGISYAANLTPDSTGLGTWKEEQFIKSLREGKFKGLDGTRPVMPPMPWISIRNFTDNELKAIFAYLKTIKPVKNAVPPIQLPATK
ncbi:MAG TPA: diheme cytochrome c-553 [Chitinophagaceae bacterium]|nr:diheme cytochrome c-553 [Chitinophagaceae bacterium]